MTLSTGVEAARADRLSRGHLHQVDVVRLLTFGGVIAVHVVAATTPGGSVPARGTLMLLHFTRETFFVITGFVLVHSAYRAPGDPRGPRPFDVRAFWRRRYLLVGVPYLVWSAVYWLQLDHRFTGAGLRALGHELLTGTAQYHLYFLLVSLQVYLAFPLLLALVRATAHRPWVVLGTSAVLQLLLFWALHDVLPGRAGLPGWVAAVTPYAEQLLPSYQFYVVAGALAAAHLDALQQWVLRHGRRLVAALVVGGAATEGVYLAQVAGGATAGHASEVLQPVMVGWTLVVTACLLAAGLAYARRRPSTSAAGTSEAGTSRVSAAVGEGARISFGVFLVHPLVITVLQQTWPGHVVGRVPAPASQALLWVLTVAIGVAVAEVAVRIPLSLPLTGRPSERGSTR